MKFFILNILIFLTPWISLSGEKLEINPAKISRGFKGEIQVKAYKSCGSRFAGLLVSQWIPSQARIGAAFWSSEKPCTFLPQHHTYTSRSLKLGNVQNLDSFGSIQLGKRLKVVKPLEFIGPHSNPYAVSYLSICRHQPIGFLIKEVRGITNVGIVLKPSKESPKTCKSQLTALKLPEKRPGRYVSYQTKQRNLLRNYRLRIKQGHVLDKSEGRKVTYRRRCNEAPIGLMIKGKREFGGIVVATYYNRRCRGKPSIETYKIPSEIDLFFPRRKKRKKIRVLQLQRPIAVTPKPDSQQLIVKSFDNCKSHIGTIVSNGSLGGRVMVGLLKGPSQHCYPVLKRSTTVINWSPKKARAKVSPLMIIH